MVDLSTSSRVLEDLMLGEYPGKILPETQYIKDTDADGSTFNFLDLDFKTIRGFLLENEKKLEPSDSYQIQKEKEIIMLRRDGVIINGKRIIDAYLMACSNESIRNNN